MHQIIRPKGASFVAVMAENSPFDILKALIEEKPGATIEELFPVFRNRLAEAPEECQRAVDYYFCVNMHRVITDVRPTNRHDRAPVDLAVMRSQRETQITQGLERLHVIIMLDLTMPNGKAMKDCTGAEMAKFGNRFQKLAEKVGKTKTVGSVLSEDQVKAIMK